MIEVYIVRLMRKAEEYEQKGMPWQAEACRIEAEKLSCEHGLQEVLDTFY